MARVEVVECDSCGRRVPEGTVLWRVQVHGSNDMAYVRELCSVCESEVRRTLSGGRSLEPRRRPGRPRKAERNGHGGDADGDPLTAVAERLQDEMGRGRGRRRR